MRTFGLTGGIGCGKSTVARLLTERHAIPIVDADVVAREVVAKGSAGLAAIVATFGADVLDADGALDRARMRGKVLSDPDARRRLEAITHPAIFEAIRARLAALAADGHPLAGVEAALMVETGSWRAYDALVVVACAPDTQVARVVARDRVDEASARAVLAAQVPTSEKVRLATHVITNDGALDALVAQVDTLAADLRREAAAER